MKAQGVRQAVDYNDIQGLVRFAHGRLTESAFVLLTIKDAAIARKWLASAPVTTAEPQSPLPDSALQLAFTAAGLLALEVDESVVNAFSQEFTSGICKDENRSRRLGDTGENHPSAWEWGGTAEHSPELLLLVYTLPGKLTGYLKELRKGDFGNAFELLKILRSKTDGPKEPFGFVDGISQPQIDWQQSLGSDPHERDKYGNLLSLGEVVLGYRNEYGLYTDRPLLDATQLPLAQSLPIADDHPSLRDLGRNGTYLVMRQLNQDVVGFWQFINREAGADAQGREQLASAMVGRTIDGAPLAGPSAQSLPGIGFDNRDNRFTFDEDPLGERCPIGAHIRRANPRTGDFPPATEGAVGRLLRTLGFGRRHPGDDLVASSRFHRLVRRGRVFGSRLTPEQAIRDKPLKKAQESRGLYFICLGANISRQFEFVQGAWIASSKFAGLPTEGDPLLGNREPLSNGAATNHFSIPEHGNTARRIEGLPGFVTVRGGAYFFMPGLRALKFILQQR